MKRKEDYEKVLSWINRKGWKSQRVLAAGTGMALGTANKLLKEMTEAGFLLREQNAYCLTKKGREQLSSMRQGRDLEKLSLPGSGEIRTAVLLAAGENKNFPLPEGLLEVGGIRILDRILGILREKGIQKIYVIIGAKAEAYEKAYEKACREGELVFIRNEHYHWSGTMYSLSLARDYVKEDFLLVECNQIFEETAISQLLEPETNNAILVTVPSGSGDEAYVELEEDGSIFRISKDIRQLNHIDGEAVGLCRITGELYQRMLTYYEKNTNPMLNYEYVLESIGRIYGIQGLLVNDLVWTVIEDQERLDYANNYLYAKILKRETKAKEKQAAKLLVDILQIDRERIGKVRIGGGMTNSNYFVHIDEKDYILRVPGACTEAMVNRENEKYNTELGESLGIHPATPYFDSRSGIKITEYIPGAATMSARTARLEHSMKKTTALLRSLHESGRDMKGHFSVAEEFAKYKQMLRAAGIVCYKGFWDMEDFFDEMMRRLESLGLESKPCHNDLVPENFVFDREGKLYLIDWEYAGMNDPMWDLASHLLECSFVEDEEELFLHYYFGRKPSSREMEKIAIFKISQDLLWTAWTMLKEDKGDHFGSYGQDRLKRAVTLREEYVKIYG